MEERTELAQMKETRLNKIRILKNEKQRFLLKLARYQVNKSTLRTEDFGNCSRPLWETEAQTNLEADWIQSIEQLS